MAHEARTDLSDLTKERRKVLALSLRGLAARCIDPEEPEAGSKWKYTTIDRLEKGLPIEAPDASQLEALAAGLEVPSSLAKEAAAGQFFGIDMIYSEDREARTLIHNYRSLSADDRAKVQALLEVWRTPPATCD
ncbi:MULTISPECIES: XRE family transcriptional regulator [unclassified Streptomyces]|uniref:XRE family transcriptional regulator n=1 Tax=unclassified Streptomyces TaxID=2593676 RepID=UPI0037FCC9C5